MLRSSEEQVAVAADAPQTTPERLRLSRDLMVRLSAAAMLRLNGGCSSLSPQAPSSCCNKNEVPRSPAASRRQLFGRASRTDTSSSKAPELSAAVGAAAETTPASPTTRAHCCILAAHLTAAADSRLSQSAASAPSAPRQTRRAPEVKCHLAAGGTSNAAPPPPATTPQGCSYAARPLAQQTCLQSRGGVSQRRQSVSDKKTPQSSSAVFHLCCEENASKHHNYNYELSETVILGSNLIYKQRPNSIQLLHSSSQSCCCCYCADTRSNKKQEPEIEVNRSDTKNKDNKNVVESGDADARLSSSSSSEICFSVFASTKPRERTGTTTTTTKTTERITTQLFNGPNDDNGARNEGADLEPKRRQRPKKRRQNDENLPSRTRQKKNVAIETGSAPKNPPKQTTTTTSRPVKFHRCTSRDTSKLAMLWTILCTMLLFCTCLHTGLSLKPEVTLHSNSSEQTIKLTTTTTTRAPTALRLQASGAREQDELNRAIMATMSTAAPDSVAGSGSFGQHGGNNNSWARRRPEPEADADVDQSAMLESGFGGGDPNDLQQSPQQATMLGTASMAFDRFIEFGRIFIMGAIIVGDICGNSLVILSVCRHSKLRVTTNWFVVSLACADILVALFAMTFNASVIISGRWLFSRWVCDFWNSCDVLASTASILHLCCISIDRYIAIMRPLDYPMKITTKRVMYALCAVWISSALLSYIPIFTGIYTTQEHIKWLKDNPDQCEFVVNRVYAIVSSSISFWIPCCIMVFTYYRIYREATRQEKFIYKTQAIMPAPQPASSSANHHSHHHHSHHNNNANSASRSKTRRSKSMAVVSGSGLQPNAAATAGTHKPPTIGRPAGATFELPALRSVASKQQATSGSGATSNPATTTLSTTTTTTLGDATDARLAQKCIDEEPDVNNNNNNTLVVDIQRPTTPQLPTACNQQQQDDADRDSNSGQSTPTKRSISKMKREHKAAKTLGIIMGVFILCWLPFFSWYTPQHICGKNCDGMVPHSAVTILFWIGYFNSTLNPIIYAYFNHEFRDAFKKTLQWIFCCCTDLKCLRVNRPNENQHYNCTYRSTQEIGLVSNG